MLTGLGDKLAYMSTLSERVHAALEAADMDQSDLARRIGVSSVAVNNWCTGATKSIKGENLLKAASALKVRPDWLAYGNGPMRATQAAFIWHADGGGETPPIDLLASLEGQEGNAGVATAQMGISSNPAAQVPLGSSIRTYETVEELDPDSYVLVDRYDVQLSAGCGNIQWVVNEKDPISFRARWFQQKRLNPDHCKALYVRGRSMEPKLEDWDTVLIDTSQTAIVDGEIYAVCLDDEFFIKTVQRIAGGVLLKSENPDFANIEVTGERMNTLCIMGKKVWRGG